MEMNLYKKMWEHPRYKEYLNDVAPHWSLITEDFHTQEEWDTIATETLDIWIRTFYPAMPLRKK